MRTTTRIAALCVIALALPSCASKTDPNFLINGSHQLFSPTTPIFSGSVGRSLGAPSGERYYGSRDFFSR